MTGQASQTTATRGVHASQLRWGRPAGGAALPKRRPTGGSDKDGKGDVEDGCGGDAVIEEVGKHFGLDHAVDPEGKKNEAAEGDGAKRGRSGKAAGQRE